MRRLFVLVLALVGFTMTAPTPAFAAINPGQIQPCGQNAVYFVSANDPMYAIASLPTENSGLCLPGVPGYYYNGWYDGVPHTRPWLDSLNWVAVVNVTHFRLWIHGITGHHKWADCISPQNAFYLSGRDAQPFTWGAIQIDFRTGLCPELPEGEASDLAAACAADGPYELLASYTTSHGGHFFPLFWCYQLRGVYALAEIYNGGLIDWQVNFWQKRVWMHEDAGDIKEGSGKGGANCYDSGWGYVQGDNWGMAPANVQLTLNPTGCNP